MEYIITVTSKGQATVPAAVRKALGVSHGGKLRLHLSKNNKITIDKPLSLDEITAKYSKLIKPGTPPLMDAGAFYETREPRL